MNRLRLAGLACTTVLAGRVAIAWNVIARVTALTHPEPAHASQ